MSGYRFSRRCCAQGTPGPRRSAFPCARESSPGKSRRRTHRRTGGRDCPRSRHKIDAEIVAGRDVAPCHGVERRKVEVQIRLAAVQQVAAEPTVVQVERGRNLDGIEPRYGHEHARDTRNAASRRKARLRPQAPPARAVRLDHLEHRVRRVRIGGGDEFWIDRAASHARIRRGGLGGRLSDDERTCPITNGSGAPGEIRTPNLQIRSLMLCPVELRAPWERPGEVSPAPADPSKA